MALRLDSQKVLVTGAAGFIGARLVQRLIDAGHRASSLIAVDELALFAQRKCTQGFGEGVKLVERDSLPAQLEALKPDIIFHLGASSSTTEFREDYLQKVNVEYSQGLWKWCAKARVPFIYASSAATYGDGAQGYSDERAGIAKLKALNPYGDSKQRFDLWAIGQKEAPPSWAGLKFFNVYGPHEDHKGGQASVVWHAREQILSKGRVRLFKSHREGIADGEQKRDFVYVDDCVDLMFWLAEGPAPSDIYNCGTGKARSFLDLARATASALGRELTVEWVETPAQIRERYQYWTQAEMSKVRGAGYTRPFTSLEEGVRRYLDEVGGA